jgi:hypothetical protein
MTDDTGRVIAHGHGDYLRSDPMATGSRLERNARVLALMWRPARQSLTSQTAATSAGPNGDLRGLVRGINPAGWMAHVAYVRSGENRSHGSSLGAKLRRFCDGTRFKYAFA